MTTEVLQTAMSNLEENGFWIFPLTPTLDLFEEIEKLKKKRMQSFWRTTIKRADIQDIADYIGDSLGLAQQAEKQMPT